MSVARFIADQRTNYRVPHAFSCRLLGVSESWFYKWIKGPVTARAARRAGLDAAVRAAFQAADQAHGSPRLHLDLTDPLPSAEPLEPAGEPWRVSVNTVADSMRRQGLVARIVKRPKGLTRQDKAAPKFPDLLRRDFTADAPNQRWVGDMTEIPTDEGKLYLATVLDLCSRRLLAAPTSEHPNARLACDAIRMAVAVRGGADNIAGVIFHTDRGSTRDGVHRLVRRPEDTAEHGSDRLMLRQQRGGGVVLHPRVGGAAPAPLQDQGRGPPGDQQMGSRVLQPQEETQHDRDDLPRRLRAIPYRQGQRGLNRTLHGSRGSPKTTAAKATPPTVIQPPTPGEATLDPLLLVAGLSTAVIVLCLLLLVSRPAASRPRG